MAVLALCASTAAAQTTVLAPDSSGMLQLHARRLGLSTFTGYNRFFGREQFSLLERITDQHGHTRRLYSQDVEPVFS